MCVGEPFAGFIPAMSALGRTLLGFSIFGALYSVFYLVWIMKNRKVCGSRQCVHCDAGLFEGGSLCLHKALRTLLSCGRLARPREV